MALHRKKKRDTEGNFIPEPVKCGICKVETTIFTVHGGIATHGGNGTGPVGGRTCCDSCFANLKELDKADRSPDYGQSEAEYQISQRWGI